MCVLLQFLPLVCRENFRIACLYKITADAMLFGMVMTVRIRPNDQRLLEPNGSQDESPSDPGREEVSGLWCFVLVGIKNKHADWAGQIPDPAMVVQSR